MPSIATRIIRAVFQFTIRTISTLPTMAEVPALAALLVPMNKCVMIQATAQGFTMSEVAA